MQNTKRCEKEEALVLQLQPWWRTAWAWVIEGNDRRVTITNSLSWDTKRGFYTLVPSHPFLSKVKCPVNLKSKQVSCKETTMHWHYKDQTYYLQYSTFKSSARWRRYRERRRFSISRLVHCVHREDFTYLKWKTWSAVWKLDRVWKSPASLQQKFPLFKASALTVLLYGCEYWVLTSDLCSQLDSFQTSCIRIILGVSRTFHVSNEKVYDRTGTVPFSLSV